VRVPIPSLTEERRKDMVKLVAKLTEEGRVHVRQVRHDVNKEIKHKQDDGAVSEDDSKRLIVDVQKLTDRYVGLLDELLKKKTAEVMEV
jgi:ribosome recycling factor